MRGKGTLGAESSTPKRARDLLAMLARDGGEHVRKPGLLEGHDVLVGVDPGDLHVHARELGVVPGGERGIGTEHGADLEHLAEAAGHRHLLVELG